MINVPPGKERITIRLDTDILDYCWDLVDRADGGNHQTLSNNALRVFIGDARKPTLEETLQ